MINMLFSQACKNPRDKPARVLERVFRIKDSHIKFVHTEKRTVYSPG